MTGLPTAIRIDPPPAGDWKVTVIQYDVLVRYGGHKGKWSFAENELEEAVAYYRDLLRVEEDARLYALGLDDRDETVRASWDGRRRQWDRWEQTP